MKNHPIKTPNVAVDAVVFTIQDEVLKVLLIEIAGKVYKNKWALPGGSVTMKETLDKAAERILAQKTNVKGYFLEQLYTFGGLKRDTRSRTISVAYLALVDNPSKIDLKTSAVYSDVSWFDVDKLPALAFDHKEIISHAVDRLRAKIKYSSIAYGLMSKEFTLTELQKTYEVILGEEIDKRNFRKKILALGIVQKVPNKKSYGAYRPADLYSFKKRELIIF